MRWFEPAAGVVLMILALLDLFLTVLYARAGAGFISERVARLVWGAFYKVSTAFGKQRAIVLSVSGSAIVVALVFTWAAILTLGSALIIHPYLGSGVKGNDSSTDTTFLTALYAGGSSMSLVGSSDYSPKTTPFRVVFLFNSLVGMSVMSLALTYIMQIYHAVQQTNTYGLSLQQMCRSTGDAAVLIQGLAPNNEFTAGYSNLGQMADATSAVREAHDFYPVLFYFRFPEPRYSASRTTLLGLDTVSLLRAAIPDGKNAWIKRAASVSQLWEASISLLRTLEESYSLEDEEGAARTPTAQDEERWRRRFLKALPVLRDAGIETVADEEAGAQNYIQQRGCWNHYVVNHARYMGWSMDTIDPAGSC